jgi:hypothetical protein
MDAAAAGPQTRADVWTSLRTLDIGVPTLQAHPAMSSVCVSDDEGENEVRAGGVSHVAPAPQLVQPTPWPLLTPTLPLHAATLVLTAAATATAPGCLCLQPRAAEAAAAALACVMLTAVMVSRAADVARRGWCVWRERWRPWLAWGRSAEVVSHGCVSVVAAVWLWGPCVQGWLAACWTVECVVVCVRGYVLVSGWVKHEHADLVVAAELTTVPLLRLGDDVVSAGVGVGGGGGGGGGVLPAGNGEVVAARGAGGRTLRRVDG